MIRRLSTYSSDRIRNVAIIAHVDHGKACLSVSTIILGKTTLVDSLLKQCGAVAKDTTAIRVMDSNQLEFERGITILAKCTSLAYKNVQINLVDTPGHADFGGEVERALSLVDGVLLVVDATEGPMPQTRFVLQKALARNLKPIVVLNKVDRDCARPDEVDSEVLDLFMNLGASDEQLNYPILFASGKDGWALPTCPDLGSNFEKNMHSLLDLILSAVPHPAPVQESGSSFSFLVNNIEKNNFLGRCLLGKVNGTAVKLNDRVKAISPEGKVVEESKITKIFKRHGLDTVIGKLKAAVYAV